MAALLLALLFESSIGRDIIAVFFAQDIVSRKRVSNSVAEVRRQAPDLGAVINLIVASTTYQRSLLRYS
jgi:hypothetical protein